MGACLKLWRRTTYLRYLPGLRLWTSQKTLSHALFKRNNIIGASIITNIAVSFPNMAHTRTYTYIYIYVCAYIYTHISIHLHEHI